MTRRCSHCSNNGHNSRTCPTRCGGGISGGGVKLFGVRLTDGSFIKKSASMGNLSSAAIKKSASMGNLSAHYHSSSSAAASPNQNSPSADPLPLTDGYLSDDPSHASLSSKRCADRKKGTPWTEEEHRRFLLGLQKLGKGDWRGISRNFVLSRTPTQVASHAQKYFIRQCNAAIRRKRRSSLFDMAPDMANDLPLLPEDQFMLPPQAEESDKTKSPPLTLSLKPDSESMDLSLKPNSESMEATPSEMVEDTTEVSTPLVDLPPAVPIFYPAYLPLLYPFWPLNSSPLEEEGPAPETSHHQVLKPIPLFPKEPVNVDELVGMSQLSLKESVHIEPLRLSLKLTGEHSRQSAFHASIPISGSDMNKGDGI